MQNRKIKISKKRYAQMMLLLKETWDCLEVAFFIQDQFELFLIRRMKMDPGQANLLARGHSTRDFAMRAITNRFTAD